MPLVLYCPAPCGGRPVGLQRHSSATLVRSQPPSACIAICVAAVSSYKGALRASSRHLCRRGRLWPHALRFEGRPSCNLMGFGRPCPDGSSGGLGAGLSLLTSPLQVAEAANYQGREGSTAWGLRRAYAHRVKAQKSVVAYLPSCSGCCDQSMRASGALVFHRRF